MNITLFLFAMVGLAYSAIFTQPARKSPSLRAEMIKNGTYSDFLAKKHLARIEAIRSNSAVASQPLDDYYDEHYLVDVGLGTPSQHFNVIVDTGSSDLWVTSSACSTAACHGNSGYDRRQFKSEFSSTFAKTSEQFSLPHGDGSGYIAKDVLNLGGLVCRTQEFGLANSVSQSFGYSDGDGVLGLGWPALATPNVIPPIQNLLNQLDQPIFTVWLDRHVKLQGDELGGLITYGALDHINCDAQVDYVTLSSKSYWQFPMTSFAFGTYSWSTTLDVISDTVSSWIGAPSSAVSAIVNATGAKYDYQHELYYVPCSGAYVDMMFTIGGQAYHVPSSEYILDLGLENGHCALALYAVESGGFGPSWILGQPFIRTYCNIYDVGKGRIGFAKVHHSETEQTTTSSASSIAVFAMITVVMLAM